MYNGIYQTRRLMPRRLSVMTNTGAQVEVLDRDKGQRLWL